MNQRTQYYGPDGEKLPVGIYADYTKQVFKVVDISLKGEVPFAYLSVTVQDAEDDENLLTANLDEFLNIAYWDISLLYASDFTEEELKELVDEKETGEG